ncbi:ATP synthase subunit b, mitochondrial [Bacillus rossius redtenbacheri]|uniref:ATP synthase subunit b, mitochondrial n=1 Tax=Bacillus rossius redtenbacheri TaxID=93214 RepID=UPI002FDD093B
MLSRVSLRAVAQLQAGRPLVGACTTHTSAASSSLPSTYQEPPERDVVNFPRRAMPIHPAPVKYGFIPEEWFTFFYKKTGVTGPYMFTVGLGTYLFSKEILVCEHEFYTGLSLGIMCIFAVKKFGPKVAEYLDKEVDAADKELTDSRDLTVKSLEEGVALEKLQQWRAEGQNLLFEAKKENVALQLEAAYRERVAAAYQEVKRRLDYQVERLNVDRRIAHKHMVSWIVSSVLKSLTPQQEKESLQRCIADLQALSARA